MFKTLFLLIRHETRLANTFYCWIVLWLFSFGGEWGGGLVELNEQFIQNAISAKITDIATTYLNLIQPRVVLLVRSPCKISEPYDNPFWDFSNGGKSKKINLPKIVAYLSCSAGRTHFTQTKKKIMPKNSGF